MTRIRERTAKSYVAVALSLLLLAGTTSGSATDQVPYRDTCQYWPENPNSVCGICINTSDCGTYYGSPLCCQITAP